MTTLKIVKQSHHSTMDRAEAYLELLTMAKTPDADTLAAEIRKSVDQTMADMQDAANHKVKAKEAAIAAKDATADLKMIVGGTYAVIEVTSPKLFAKLPDRNTWKGMAPVQQAQHLEDTLVAAGKDAKVYADQVEVVAKRRQAAMQLWITIGSAKQSAHTATTSVSELKLYIAQADVLLRKLGPAGSVLDGLRKKARGGGKRKAKPEGTTTGTTAGQPAPAPATVPAPAPTPAPIAVTPEVVVAPPAPVVAISEVPPVPASSLNGAFLNGAAHP